MSEPERENGSGLSGGLVRVGAVILAIGCCAALPLVAAFAGSVAVGTLLGVVAGAVALIVLVSLIVVRARRRAGCEAPEASAAVKPSQPTERETA